MAKTREYMRILLLMNFGTIPGADEEIASEVIPSCIQVDILKTFEVLKTSKVWPEICAILNVKANNY
jgi:hypothetical protein